MRILSLIYFRPAFDGHLDTPVEALHVVLLGVAKYLYRDMVARLTPGQRLRLQGRWQSLNIEGLNIPPVQPRNLVHHANSLLGKDFRLVLQAAPFVFFEFISDSHRHCWISLAHLASYVFQTQIFDKEAYRWDVKTVVARFLNQLVRLNAQWTNKPKFHMLTHLSSSIDRFGPLSLYTTEKLEGYNGVTRIASVHSNRHAPGRDIANAYNNDRLVKMLLSGGSFVDSKLGIRATASPLVQDLFKQSEIRKGLGFHLSSTDDSGMWRQKRKVQNHINPFLAHSLCDS